MQGTEWSIRADGMLGGVTCVLVTYDDRQRQLTQVVDGLRVQGLRAVVVVDNGASWDVRGILGRRYGSLVHVLSLGKNIGSAAGYASGIHYAIRLGSEYILLLDDDNLPDEDSIVTLYSALQRYCRATPRNRVAVAAFRPSHYRLDLALHGAGVPGPRPDSFRGLHFLDLPWKVWRRTPLSGRTRTGQLPALVKLHMAPYGGLLFHRDLVDCVGFPNPDLVIYGDDDDWTYRIHERGGCILLVTGAVVNDLLPSWNMGRGFANTYRRVLNAPGDARAYYSMRNGVYFDTQRLRRHRWQFRTNMVLYLTILSLFALMYRRVHRLRILLLGVLDGLNGRLGMHPRFPL